MLDKHGLWELVNTIEEKTSIIDILVNNADVGQIVPLTLTKEEGWDRVMDTTMKAVF